VLVGLAAGAIWTLAQPERHRAEARMLVKGAEANRVVPAVEALAESSLLEQNVAQTLHLSQPPQVNAAAGTGGVLTVSVEAGNRERARQIDAEATVVLTQLVSSRFRAAGIEATVLDPAHPIERTSPTPGRNFLVAGAAGLAVGLLVALALRARWGAAGVGDDRRLRELEQRLTARLKAVTERERALARRAGELAAQERRLGRPISPPPAAPRPIPESSAPPPAARRLSGRTPAGGWEGGRSLDELETLVALAPNASDAQREEWRTYLFFLREHADATGRLPASFDSLVAEVFCDLLA
jgi:hypothetical protein